MTEEEILCKHTGLVVSQVRTFKPSRVVSRHDLIQVGNMALLVAIRKYSPDKGEFSTFATVLIRNAILNELRRFRDKYELLRVDLPYFPKEKLSEVLPKLTRKQGQVLRLRLMGHSTKEIGGMLKITQRKAREIFASAKERIREANA